MSGVVWDLRIAETFRAESAEVYGTITCTFQLNQFALLDVADFTATARAKVADRREFLRALQFESLRRRLNFRYIQAETAQRNLQAAKPGRF